MLLPVSEAEFLKPEISVLIVTATETESDEMLKHLEPLPSQTEVIRVYAGNQTYYIGLFGIYGIVLVQSEMGSVGPNASTITTLNAINLWEPKAVIMVGIAFGVDDEKQHIGDVLISSHIIPYEFDKLSPKGIQYRSALPIANTLLVNRARAVRNWDYKIEGKKVKVYLGPILTGEKLIDDKPFRDDLVNHYKNTIGGEMESAGVFAAANDTNTPWLIIKSICDFADGNKGKRKEMNQELAIKASVSFTYHYLSDWLAFSELDFLPLVAFRGEPQTSEDVQLSSLISFLDNYDSASEKSAAEQLRVSAREISQTDADSALRHLARTVSLLIPTHTLELFEKRIQFCWDSYNEVLDAPEGFLPSEVDNATAAIMRCICRELHRLKLINGGLPPDPKFNQWWESYNCQTSIK